MARISDLITAWRTVARARTAVQKEETKMPFKKKLVCGICKKSVIGVSVLKHLWSAHREHMMENRARGPRPKKTKPVASSKVDPVAVVKALTVETAAKTVTLSADFILYEIFAARLGKKSHEAALDSIYEHFVV